MTVAQPIGLTVTACLALLASALQAQCPLTFATGYGSPGPDAQVRAMTEWDPDGPGPLPIAVVVAGDFVVAGDILANHIALLDPITRIWSSIGTVGANDSIRALAVLPNGNLVAGGDFTQIGGVAADHVAILVGDSWAPLGSGTDDDVYSLLAQPNGDLVVGGAFRVAGGVPRSGVALWSGGAWASIGTGVAAINGNWSVRAIVQDASGTLVIGGCFDTLGGTLFPSLANLVRWNGTTWVNVGGGVSDPLFRPCVDTLSLLPNGDLLVGGDFSLAGGLPAGPLASWNGFSWTDEGLGSGTSYAGLIRATVSLPGGGLVVGGSFGTIGGNVFNYLATRPTPTSMWQPVGAGLDNGSEVFSLLVPTSGDLVVGGWFTNLEQTGATNLAIRSSNQWLRTGPPGLVGAVGAVLAMQNGDVVIGGGFRSIDGVPFAALARWDGSAWNDIGGGIASISGGIFIRDMVEMPNGDLVVAGSFQQVSGQPIRAIARWDGSSWSQLGSGLFNYNVAANVFDLELLQNGDLVAVGWFTTAGGAARGIARWNGVSWQAIGTLLANEAPESVCELPNGDIAIGLRTGPAQVGTVRVWDGTSWTQLGSNFGEFETIAFLGLDADGSLLAGGSFEIDDGAPADNLARWNGSSWQPVGAGLDFAVQTVLVLPDGALLAAGSNNQTAWPSTNGRFARLQNGVWGAVAGGINGPYVFDGTVFDMALARDGRLWVAGYFSAAGGNVSLGVATLSTPCPAKATAEGAGCAGSGGANVLTATALPWIGGTFRSQATGMPANGLALGVRGFGTALTPLAVILPQGQPGCDLLVTADLLDLRVPVAGTIATSIDIPNAAALVGQVLFEQIVPVELGALGNITALTSTNRLQLTIGAF